MLMKEKQLENLKLIHTELTSGIKEISRFGLKRWKYNVNELQQKIDAFDKKLSEYVATIPKLSSIKVSSRLIMDEEIDTDEIPSDLFTALYEIIQGVRNLITAYHLIDAHFVKAITEYCKLIDEIYFDQADSILTDSQLNYLFHTLYRGATYPSVSSKFQRVKKATKENIEKSLASKLEDYKKQHVQIARDLLSKEDSIEIEFEPSNFVGFRNVTPQQKKEHYTAFKKHILEILEMQKSFPLNPAFANAVGKYLFYLKDNIETKKKVSVLTAAKERQNDLLMQQDNSLDKSKEIVPFLKGTSTAKNELSDQYGSIAAIRDKLTTGIGKLHTSFTNKDWNSHISSIKDNLKLLNDKLDKVVKEKPTPDNGGKQISSHNQEELKEIFNLLFKLIVAVCKLSSTHRLTEVDLVGVVIDYCKFLITSYSKLLYEYEMKRISCNDESFDLNESQFLKPLLKPKQLVDIYKDFLEGAKWPSKSAYFNEYRRQKKQELAAALGFIQKELDQEVKKFAYSKLPQDGISNLKINTIATLDFERYDDGKRRDVYSELEYYFFETLELQKESPLNIRLATGVETFILELKKNYDEKLRAIKELTKKVYGQECLKGKVRAAFEEEEATSPIEDKEKVVQIKKRVSQKMFPAATQKRLVEATEVKEEALTVNQPSRLIDNRLKLTS